MNYLCKILNQKFNFLKTFRCILKIKANAKSLGKLKVPYSISK